MPLFVRCLSIRGCPSTTTEEKKRKKKKKEKKGNKKIPSQRQTQSERKQLQGKLHALMGQIQTDTLGLFIINVVTLDRY